MNGGWKLVKGKEKITWASNHLSRASHSVKQQTYVIFLSSLDKMTY